MNCVTVPGLPESMVNDPQTMGTDSITEKINYCKIKQEIMENTHRTSTNSHMELNNSAHDHSFENNYNNDLQLKVLGRVDTEFKFTSKHIV